MALRSGNRELGEGPSLKRANGFWIGSFHAMASPCELLVETEDRQLARRLTDIAFREARRIERKFSRYRSDNIVHRINHARGKPVEVDPETANLLDYAGRCFDLSGGSFDITSGVLREVWRFGPEGSLPSPEAVAAVLSRIGWERAGWNRPRITLPEGMEIDLGGIGKEYAVDRAVQLLRQHADASFVVNFGGDLFVTGPRRDGTPWKIAVEDPRRIGTSVGTVALQRGALATSGDSRRFLVHEGVRYGHILDPRTGWPVQGGPQSVTVWGENCMEAGMLATFAILQGRGAHSFLSAQGVPFWLR